jgi:hypothetical protein
MRKLTTNPTCDECGKLRGVGNHAACSKARQARYNSLTLAKTNREAIMEQEKEARNNEIRAKHAAGTSRMELIIEYRLSPARIGQSLNPEIQKRYNAKKAGKV